MYFTRTLKGIPFLVLNFWLTFSYTKDQSWIENSLHCYFTRREEKERILIRLAQSYFRSDNCYVKRASNYYIYLWKRYIYIYARVCVFMRECVRASIRAFVYVCMHAHQCAWRV